MPLRVAASVTIPDDELSVSCVRSSGPGGQNVNKVASAVQLRFDLAHTRVLSDGARARLRALAGRRLTAEGAILIIARNHRTQESNRREAEDRLADLIRRSLTAPRPRRATRPTQASRERRLDHKARQQRTKRLRTRPRWDE